MAEILRSDLQGQMQSRPDGMALGMTRGQIMRKLR